jgi:hypothetical protein
VKSTYLDSLNRLSFKIDAVLESSSTPADPFRVLLLPLPFTVSVEGLLPFSCGEDMVDLLRDPPRIRKEREKTK